MMHAAILVSEQPVINASLTFLPDSSSRAINGQHPGVAEHQQATGLYVVPEERVNHEDRG